MPQDIVAQFDRKYNEPIETYRKVSTATARDAIPSSIRWEGMLVYVVADQQTYALNGGIDNTNWQPFDGLTDAPNDGDYYVRQNQTWQILPASGGILDFSGDQTVLSGSGTETVGTYTIAGNTLQNDGDMLRITLRGAFANTANNKRPNLDLDVTSGDVSILVANSLPTSMSGQWSAQGLIIRKNATSFVYEGKTEYYGNTGPTTGNRITSGVSDGTTDWTTAKDITVGIFGGAASDITINGYEIELIKKQ